MEPAPEEKAPEQTETATEQPADHEVVELDEDSSKEQEEQDKIEDEDEDEPQIDDSEPAHREDSVDEIDAD